LSESLILSSGIACPVFRHRICPKLCQSKARNASKGASIFNLILQRQKALLTMRTRKKQSMEKQKTTTFECQNKSILERTKTEAPIARLRRFDQPTQRIIILPVLVSSGLLVTYEAFPLLCSSSSPSEAPRPTFAAPVTAVRAQLHLPTYYLVQDCVTGPNALPRDPGEVFLDVEQPYTF
jgi:hypothetical protein